MASLQGRRGRRQRDPSFTNFATKGETAPLHGCPLFALANTVQDAPF